MTIETMMNLRCEESGFRSVVWRFALGCLSLVMLGIVGCGSGGQAEPSVSFLLENEPAGATSITAAKDVLVGVDPGQTAADADPEPQTPAVEPAGTDSPAGGDAEAASTQTLVLAGKIDAGEFDPFDKDQAVFMLSELPDPAHASGDPEHADNCPFCKRRAAMAPKALVHLEDADGKVIPTDARELLGLAAGDAIVVEGAASYDAKTNILAIHATKIFKR